MATEDHDFEEINYFNLFGKKIQWDREDGGAVGELSTEGLESLLEKLKTVLGDSENANALSSLFANAYTQHENLADATRYLGNQLFSNYGLVIIDGNDPSLKKAFIPYVEKELSERHSYSKITETTKRLTDRGYPEQVHPREINLFYLTNGRRDRIIERDGVYYVNNTDLVFSRDEIRKQVQDDPQRFSPNALLRPIYQEVILPNLCYIGGGGELAYWFQLKDYFESLEVPFPVLLLRNSVLLVPSKYSVKLLKLDVEIESLFLPDHELEDHFIRQLSEIKIDFSKQKEHLVQQFEALYKTAKQTDGSFFGAVAAQEKKQLNGLSNLEKRLLKAQKRRKSEQLERLIGIQQELFPNESLQERSRNFSEFYLVYAERLFKELKDNLDPLANEFSILNII